MSAPKEAQQQRSEERERLLGYEAVAVKKHQQTFSAEELVDTRKALIYLLRPRFLPASSTLSVLACRSMYCFCAL